MSYTPTDWKDRVVEKPRTFTMQDNGDGTITLIPAPGTVVQEGTPVNAANLNKIEQGFVSHLAEIVTQPAANKILRLNVRGEFPFTVLGGRLGLSQLAALGSTSNAHDGDKTITIDTDFLSPVMAYNNLTINSGVTFNCPFNAALITIAGTLTLNGVIDISGMGAGGGRGGRGIGDGGAGGGALIIITNKIAGTGYIKANGMKGKDAIKATGEGSGEKGEDGTIFATVVGGGLGAGIGTNGVAGGRTPPAAFMETNFMLPFLTNRAAGGGGGRAAYSSSGTLNGGGGGGGGLIGSGGRSGAGLGGSSSSAGGGGGGGGGGVWVISLSPIPGIHVQAIGGAGGGGYYYGGGGGGGGGGGVHIIAPNSSAIISVSGGAAGSHLGDVSKPPEAGSAGLAMFTAI